MDVIAEWIDETGGKGHGGGTDENGYDSNSDEDEEEAGQDCGPVPRRLPVRRGLILRRYDDDAAMEAAAPRRLGGECRS